MTFMQQHSKRIKKKALNISNAFGKGSTLNLFTSFEALPSFAVGEDFPFQSEKKYPFKFYQFIHVCLPNMQRYLKNLTHKIYRNFNVGHYL